ncbi:MAG: hypothetical protein WA784_17930 [Albidovulum sp.]
MIYPSLSDFLASSRDVLGADSVAVIFVEDDTEIASTVARMATLGFAQTLILVPPQIKLPDDLPQSAHQITYDVLAPAALPKAINALIGAASEKTWFHYCYNAEYLFFPFCEGRRIGEVIAFHTEERRDAMLTYVVDLYAADLARNPDAVSLETAMIDRSGYYAEPRFDAQGTKMERQFDYFGGIRWRFEEHIPWTRRRIDRISLFRAQKALRLDTEHRFNIEEYNTYACPWHHNITAAVASFRTAKALRTNPGSKWAINSFVWHGSVPFDWSSAQLMDLGIMEPGQWF